MILTYDISNSGYQGGTQVIVTSTSGPPVTHAYATTGTNVTLPTFASSTTTTGSSAASLGRTPFPVGLGNIGVVALGGIAVVVGALGAWL